MHVLVHTVLCSVYTKTADSSKQLSASDFFPRKYCKEILPNDFPHYGRIFLVNKEIFLSMFFSPWSYF